MPEGFNKLLSTTSEVVKAIPEVYTDLAQPTVREVGKTLSIIPKAINAALAPLQQWIDNKDFNIAETKKLLAIKLEHVGEDKIVPPDAYVAVPALQAISYSMNSDVLRNLYASLLAKSMNIDTKDYVHPSYVETIKQLSPADASYFKHICSLPNRPIVETMLTYPESTIITIDNRYNAFSKMFEKTYILSIDNLSRLGLINIPNGIWYGDDSLYTPLINTLKQIHTLDNYKDIYPNAEGLEFDKQRIDITEYGKSFYNICIQ